MNSNLIAKPSRVIIEITDRCNYNCLHCFANKKDYEISVDSWKKILNNIVKEKVQSITITGGEPLLYKDLFTLLKQVKFKRVKLTLDTNGSLISENNIESIKRYFKKIRLTYYGYDRSWHANTQSNACDTKKFLEKIKLLTLANIKVQVKIPLFQNNTKKLFKILNQLKEYNLYEIVLIPILPIGKAEKLTNLTSAKTARQLIKQYNDKTRNIKVFRWANGKHFLIRSNGNVVLHPPVRKEELILGNAMDKTISELWDAVPEKYKITNKKLTTDLSNI